MKARIFIVLLILAFVTTCFSQRKPPIGKPRSHINRGLNLYRKGELKKAKKEFLIALNINKKNFIANEMLAQIFFQEKNYSEALNYAERAIKLNPRMGKAYFIVGSILLEKGEIEKARHKLKRAYELAQTKEEKDKVSKVLAKYKDQRQRSPLPVERPVESAVSPDLPDAKSSRKPYIAVFPFEETNIRTEKTEIGETLSEMLTTALIQTNAFNVMERAQLQNVLREQSLSQSGAISSETAVEVGKLVGLEAVVLGSISQLKSVVEGDARMIEVKTGKALIAVNSKVMSIDNLRSLANQLGNQLSAKAYLISIKQDTTKETKTYKEIKE